MRFATPLSVETIIVDGAACQCNDELSVAFLFVGLAAIAMTAEMFAGGIHCSQIGHGNQDDEEKGRELHCCNERG